MTKFSQSSRGQRVKMTAESWPFYRRFAVSGEWNFAYLKSMGRPTFVIDIAVKNFLRVDVWSDFFGQNLGMSESCLNSSSGQNTNYLEGFRKSPYENLKGLYIGNGFMYTYEKRRSESLFFLNTQKSTMWLERKAHITLLSIILL